MNAEVAMDAMLEEITEPKFDLESPHDVAFLRKSAEAQSSGKFVTSTMHKCRPPEFAMEGDLWRCECWREWKFVSSGRRSDPEYKWSCTAYCNVIQGYEPRLIFWRSFPAAVLLTIGTGVLASVFSAWFAWLAVPAVVAWVYYFVSTYAQPISKYRVRDITVKLKTDI